MGPRNRERDGGPEPPRPPRPPAPPPAGQQAPAAQQAEAVQDWDDPWERRARKLLGGENVGTAEDLADPEHRKWLRRKMRKAKRGRQAATATATEEVAPEEEGSTEPEVEPGTEPNLPTAQGSAGQLEGKYPASDQLAGMFPTRDVPGGGDRGDQPGGPQDLIETGLWTPEDQARQDEANRPTANFPGGQTGLWTPEDEARSRAGEQGGALQPPGGAGTAPTGEHYLTNAGPAPPEYPTPNTGSNFAQPTTPWPPPPVQPTYYTGGM